MEYLSGWDLHLTPAEASAAATEASTAAEGTPGLTEGEKQKPTEAQQVLTVRCCGVQEPACPVLEGAAGAVRAESSGQVCPVQAVKAGRGPPWTTSLRDLPAEVCLGREF